MSGIKMLVVALIIVGSLSVGAASQQYVLALYVYDSKTFDRLEGATVYVDGSLKATIDKFGSPNPNVYLLPATYSIRISKDGCTDASFSVVIPMQDTKYVAMNCNLVQTTQNPTMSSTSISPSSVLPGQSFTGYYVINNPNSNSMNVGLGLSIRRSGTTGEIVDPSNDVVISVAPGTNTYSRTFTVSSSASAGSYDVAQAIWSGSPGTGTQYATSGWKSGFLTVQQTPAPNTAPSASRYDPSSSSVSLTTGQSKTFTVRCTDNEGNLRGGDWYLNGQYKSHGSPYPISGSSATNSWSYTFSSAGTYTVEGQCWDDANGDGNEDLYSSAVTWTVAVIPPVQQNTAPSAYIDSISPNPAMKGQYIYFSGSGYDPDGSIVGYNWRSSIDGQLSTSRSFSTSSLTQGTHNIYFKVKDDSGTWSSETTKTLTVSSSKTASASIQSASVDKSSYNSGETVKVAVSIKNTGDVDLSGLKINVDIADPNGNNVKATTLKSGISLSADQTYSTGYISYYTIPSNPISGTYKVTVGLWNSDSSKNYDIEYQITSFSVSVVAPNPSDLVQKGISAIESLMNGLDKSVEIVDTNKITGPLSISKCGINFIPLGESVSGIVIQEQAAKAQEEIGKQIRIEINKVKFKNEVMPKLNGGKKDIASLNTRFETETEERFIKDMGAYYEKISNRGESYPSELETIVDIHNQNIQVKDGIFLGGDIILLPVTGLTGGLATVVWGGASCIADFKMEGDFQALLIKTLDFQTKEAIESATEIQSGIKYVAKKISLKDYNFPNIETAIYNPESVLIKNIYNKPLKLKVVFKVALIKNPYIETTDVIPSHLFSSVEEITLSPGEERVFEIQRPSYINDWLADLRTYGYNVSESSHVTIFYGEENLYAIREVKSPLLIIENTKSKSKIEIPGPFTATYQLTVLPPQTGEQPTITSPTPISSPTRIDLPPKIENLKLVAPAIKKDGSDKIQVSYKLSEGFKPFKSESSLLMAGIFKMTIKNKVSIKEKWGLFDLLTRDLVNPVEFTRTIERRGDDIVVKNEDGTSKTVTFNELDKYLRSYDYQISVKGSDFKSGFLIFEFWEGTHKNAYAEVNTEYTFTSSTNLGIPKTGSFSAKSEYVAIEVTAQGLDNAQKISGAPIETPTKTIAITTIPTKTPTQSTTSLTLTLSLKRLAIVEEAFNGKATAAAMAGLERTQSGQAFENGNYYVVDWQGDKYVALNGNTNKLAKLILEQRKILKNDGTSYIEKKTLTTGETWDVGGGWTLTAQAIDAKASPRQVWLVLNYKGVKKDDKVIAQGMIYTYVEKSIADESDVPLFMTYMDSVFVGATNDMAQFSYTWAISPSVEIIKPGDNFGGMEVVAVDNVNKRIELKKDNGQKISSITAIETPISTSKEKDLSIGETWNIGGGWTIIVQSVDAMATPKQVWLVLYRNGNKLDDKVMAEGETYSYKNIFSTKVTRIYAGTTSDRVVLADTYTS